MQYLSIDFLILYAFLAITLFIGLRTGRGIKDIREYATGNKMFTTGALVLTWLATDISGEPILSIVQNSRTRGILQILPCVGWGLAYLMQGFVFAPRFLNFPNCMTIGDVMKELYKGPSQIITGVLAFLIAMCIMVMELTVFGLFSETLLGIDFYWGIVIGGSVLVLYTAHGGIKSVTYTDMFQFIILIAILPIITMIALHHAGGMETVIASLSDAQCSVLHHPKLSKYGIILLTLGIFQFGIIDPALVQRILLAKNKRQLRNQFLAMSILLFGILLSFMMLGFISNVLFPDDTISHVVPQIIQNILPVGLKGFAYAGLFAITMSTFDSFLHAAGLTLAHDVIAPICEWRHKTIDELKIARYVTLLVGCLVIIIGLCRAENLYDFVATSYIFVGPLLAFPLFAGILGLKPDQLAFYTASIVTIITVILCNFLLPEEYDYLTGIIGVCVNGIFFLGIHAIRNKGFAIINYEKKEQENNKEIKKS